MNINHDITFTLTNEEDNAFSTVISVFEQIVGDETIPQEIRDHASFIIDNLEEFSTNYID